MAGFGGFLGGLGTAINSGIGTYSDLQKTQQRQQEIAVARLRLHQMDQELAAQAAAGQALGQGQPSQVYQPPGQGPQPAPPPAAPPGSGAPGGNFMPVNPGAPAMTPQPRPAGGPAPSAPASGGASAPMGLDPYQIAATIKRRNPGIDPAALYGATAKIISQMGPMAMSQYRDQLLSLRTELDANNIANRIRELDIRQTQGADKLAVQREALDLRGQIADLRERGANERQMNALITAVAMIATKAGIDPSSLGLGANGDTGGSAGGITGALGPVASAIKGQKNAAAADKTLGEQISDVQKDIRNTIAENGELLGGNGHLMPARGTPERARFDANVTRRQALQKQLDELKRRRTMQAPAPSDRSPAPRATDVPQGAPTATGPGGKKIYFDGTAWVPVPAEQ